MAKLVSFFLAILLTFWLTMGAPRPSMLELPSQPLALTTDIAVVNPQSSVSASYVRVDAFETVFFHVGDATRPHFGLSREDFEYLRSLGVSAIEGDFDSCANAEDVKYFLDESASVRLGVILPAQVRTQEENALCAVASQGDAPALTSDQIVENWVRQWKSHPAVIAWNTTDPQTVSSSSHSAVVQTVSQLETSYASLKAVDPIHPIFVPFHPVSVASESGTVFPHLSGVSRPIADIVLLKPPRGLLEESTVIGELLSLVSKLKTDENQTVKVLVGVGGERQADGWVFPSPTQLEQELRTLRSEPTILGVGFYRYGSKESEWYLPYHELELLPILQH